MLMGCKQTNTNFDILIVGGGASGIMAGIQAARMGEKTLILEETEWLGGMLTSAGVSAIDGNYRLPSGLWEEFRQEIYAHYGGAEKVQTGWVSMVLFEPDVAAKILKKMADQEPNLSIQFKSKVLSADKTTEGWKVLLEKDAELKAFEVKVLVDATELGDIAKMVGVTYDVGMDSEVTTGEAIAPEISNEIIQDLTYVVILEEFSKGEDHTIPKPNNYDPSIFDCSCDVYCHDDGVPDRLWDCDKMMNYGRLPNNKIMINWPIKGNDYFVNAIDMSEEERKEHFELAKAHTKNYIYFLQTELGYANYGIAKNIFPTQDGFPMIPYHRESRRIHGEVQFTLNDLAQPFEQKSKLYRTGIAVGDYPVDHHHDAYYGTLDLPDLHFYPVPSYTLPLGTLIPKNTSNFIVAEKSISVTNLVNGTTRLQPVCILIGQAAGILAALSVEGNISPSEVSVRDVQQVLLDAGAYLMPYVDVSKENPFFTAIQRIGATGILKGEGKNVGWENLTLFYPDSLVKVKPLIKVIQNFEPRFNMEIQDEFLTYKQTFIISKKLSFFLPETRILNDAEILKFISKSDDFEMNQLLTRAEFCYFLDSIVNPFQKTVDLEGFFVN